MCQRGEHTRVFTGPRFLFLYQHHTTRILHVKVRQQNDTTTITEFQTTLTNNHTMAQASVKGPNPTARLNTHTSRHNKQQFSNNGQTTQAVDNIKWTQSSYINLITFARIHCPVRGGGAVKLVACSFANCPLNVSKLQFTLTTLPESTVTN